MTPLFQQILAFLVLASVLFCFIGIPYIEDKFGVTVNENPDADVATAQAEASPTPVALLPEAQPIFAEVINLAEKRDEVLLAA